MRLLIAGILTLVIHVMTCAYGNGGGEKAPKTQKQYPIETHHFRLHLYLPDWEVQPPYLYRTNDDQIDTQMFPKV